MNTLDAWKGYGATIFSLKCNAREARLNAPGIYKISNEIEAITNSVPLGHAFSAINV